MDNCFTFTYKKLKEAGIKIPKKWDKYTYKDMRLFIKDYKYFLENKLHYKFFYSFCSEVSIAQKNDIILDIDGVGIAINRFKYMTIKDRNNTYCLCDIKLSQNILRANNG